MAPSSSTSQSTVRPILSIHASRVAALHTYIASSAFLAALFIGCLLHYKKIVKNGVAGYPQEWFPSVSATIGDWYPERNIFQIMIALASGPRFALVSLQYLAARSSSSNLPGLVFASGITRTLLCGGWVYITSNDDHDVHDVLMIAYILSNIPWMVGNIICTPDNCALARSRRKLVASAFFLSIVPMIYFFLQHKLHHIPGAYTRYSFFEWSLIFLDITYDSISEIDFRELNLKVSVGLSLENTFLPPTVAIAAQKEVVEAPPSTKLADAVHSQPEEPSYQKTESYWRELVLRTVPVGRSVLSFLADVYLSFVFWSIFTSLIPTMFFFSVWKLGIAGHELSLASTLSPILLSVPLILSWSRTRGGRSTLYLLSFLGLGAYASNDPFRRLLIVSFGAAMSVLGQTVDWASIHRDEVHYQALVTGIGLIVSSLSKHANHSNNPVWPFINQSSGGYNKTGIFLALLALCEFFLRSLHLIPRGHEARNTHTTSTQHWLFSAASLGSLIFSLHSLLSDSSTLLAWSWTGYTNGRPNGPVPNLHGSLTLIAQSFGLLLSTVDILNRNLFTHPAWYCYGALSLFIMYTYRDWPGYLGGLNAAIFLMSILPNALLSAASTNKVGRTYFVAWLIACLLDLASVWTVAYAFVPGGSYLRERSDLVLTVQIILLALNQWRPSWTIKYKSLPPKAISYIRTLLACLSVCSVLVSLYRLPRIPLKSYNPGPRIIRAGIWTLHFGMDNEGRDSQRRVRDLIRDMQLDVVGLLETDLHRVVFGNRDLTRVISEELGYYVETGPGPNSHTWGCALLSKYPIINSTHHLLPSPDGELAPAIEAFLDVQGTEVHIVVAHNGQEETPLDRELQSRELARIMASSYPAPTIFLGYVVTKPLSRPPAPYDILVTDGRIHDIDLEDWDRWCEYILYRGLYRTAYARISRGLVTDTELQIGQFVLPRHGHQVTNETEEARYLRSFKEDLPTDHWFPMEYYGSDEKGGVNRHYYHVFDTPLYYAIPDGAVL